MLQVGGFVVAVVAQGLGAEPVAQVFDDLLYRYQLAGLQGIALQQVVHRQFMALDDDQVQPVTARGALVAGLFHLGRHGHQGGEDLAVGFTGGGDEGEGHIAVGPLGAHIEATLLGTQHIALQGPRLFAPLAALGGFVLPGIVGEDPLAGGGHHRLKGVGGGGLAGAGATGEHVHMAQLEFTALGVAPVEGDQFIGVHAVPPRSHRPAVR